MGGGGGSIAKIINQISEPFDTLMPESLKKTNEKLTPEWVKETSTDFGLSAEALGLPPFPEPSTPATIEPTEVPTISNAVSQAVAKTSAKRSAVARSRSIFTTPLGLGITADTAKKILLGQ